MRKMAVVALALTVLMACGPTDEQKAMIGKTLTVQQGAFEIRATISAVDGNYHKTLYFNEAIILYPAHWQDVRVQRLEHYYIYMITAKVGDGLRNETVKIYDLYAAPWSLIPDHKNFSIEWRKKEAR